MRILKKILFICIIFILCSPLIAQDILELFPEKITELENRSTQIVIRTSKQKANVFINNDFVGVSPLTITKLVPASYKLTVENEGLSLDFQIEVKFSESREFFIQFPN